jgi:2-amino-4-hydroxy-6-hydroxymethyldihydropteridine diphosphokinase
MSLDMMPDLLRTKMEIGLSLGSNLGNRLQNIKAAKKIIFAVGNIAFVAQSSVYETEPIDVPAADAGLPFLNAILIVKTALRAPELLELFKGIELQMGRAPASPANSRRPIDIDVIYAGNLRLESGPVTIPHPRWFQRRFVLMPLNDVRPDLVIPGRTATVNEILRDITDKHRVTLSIAADKW